MKACIYTRVSTEEQANQISSTLDSQQNYAERYIDLHSHKKVAVYREEGISGKNIKARPKLKKLLQDARRRLFDIVLITDLDRISRNLRDFLYIWDIFKENNIKFVAINQNIDTSTPTGEALIQQLMIFAELERKLNQQRAEQKREFDVTQKGKWYGGTIPFGYSYNMELKKLYRNEKEAKIVIFIFNEYLKVGCIGEVTRRVNNLGYRTRRGKLFYKENIRLIIRNSIYLGLVNHKGKPYKGQHEAIIDEKIWKAANALMDKNSSINHCVTRPVKTEFLLSGLVKCGHCGFAMVPDPAKSGKYQYYRCGITTKINNSACKIKSVPARELEKAVVYGLKLFSMDKKTIDKAVSKANKVSKEKIKELLIQKEYKQKELEDTKKTIRIFLDALKTGKSKLRVIEEELTQLDNTKTTLEKEINDIQIEIEEKKRYTVDGAILKKHLTEFNHTYDTLNDKEKKNLLNLLVREITHYGSYACIKIWDLPELDKPLTYYIQPSWFVDSQACLFGVVADRTPIEINLKLVFNEVYDRGLRRGKRIDLSKLKLYI